MDKYEKAGLNFDLIYEAFPNINEYEKTIMFYFEDENFQLLKQYIEDEDYAMAKDACKGLYILASDLRMFPLYEALLEIYDDLDAEDYKDITKHYDNMINVFERIRGAFYA